MKERCLLVSSFMAEYKGSYIYSIIALIKKMHKNGDEMVLVFPKAKSEVAWVEEIKALGCKVCFLDYNPYSLNNISFIRKIVKNEKINIIHSDFTGWDITVKLACPFMPTIWHERMRVNDKNKIKRIANLIKYRIIGAFKTYPVGISDDVYQAVSRLAGRKKTTKIFNALDTSRFDLTLPKKKNELKTYLMFSYTPFVKGVDIVCDAFEKYNGEKIKAKLIIVSHGECDKYLAQRYTNPPDWLNIEKPREDVQCFYNMADVFISASRSEGFSQSLIEALYLGLSTIVSDIPGTAWSQGFKGSIYFKSGDSQSLLEAITTEQSLEKINERDVLFNQSTIINDFSVEKWAEKIIALHKKVLKK